jgi:hypothetical protein
MVSLVFAANNQDCRLKQLCSAASLRLLGTVKGS